METPLVLSCPECHSSRVVRDGHRYVGDEDIQRFLCQDCGFRFSDPNRTKFYKNNPKASRPSSPILDISQVGVLTKAINLTSTTEKTVSGDRGIDKSTAKGIRLQFSLYLDKEGYGKDCRYVDCIRMLLNSKCNIYDPENVKEVIAAKKTWKNGTKMQASYAYDAFTRMAGLSWVMPIYRQEECLFFLADESELDALIDSTRSKRMKAFLLCLKEIWGDPSEVLGLRWIDADTNRNVIVINNPVKNHNPRELEVTPRLMAMLNQLPKTSEFIFVKSYEDIPRRYRSMQSTYVKLRKRVAHDKLNPRILSISFISFRHWGGTQLAQITHGNVLIVKEKLGHKKVENTMKYIGRINWKLNPDFDTATATTDEEIKNLGASGWEKYDERTLGANVTSYYKRPKRLGSVKV